MLNKVIRVPTRPLLPDPARDAARLLGWSGMSVLMVAAPLAGVLSRRSLFILLPIGTALLLSAFLLAVSRKRLAAFRGAVLHPIGLIVGFALLWAVLSLLWTPFPGTVAPSLLASVACIVTATSIIALLPERRATRALYLLPAGLAITALATLGMALLEPATFRGGSEFDPSLLERSVLTLVVLVWPALGALASFARWGLATVLATIVAATVTIAGAQIGMAAFAMGAVTFAMAVDDAPRTARRAAILFGGLFALAPLLPFVLAPLAEAIPMVGRSTVAAMSDWQQLVLDDGLRLTTGHGIGTSSQGVGVWLPPHTPRSTLFESWYELGALGALSLSAALALGFHAAGRAAPVAAPSLLAGMVVTIAIAVFGVATAEVWFIALASLQAVALGLLCRMSRGQSRAPTIAVARSAESGREAPIRDLPPFAGAASKPRPRPPRM